MRASTREKLANEAATWRHLGLVDDALAATLALRYDARASRGRILLRWLGLFGALLLTGAVLGFVAMVSGGSIAMSAATLALAGGGAWLLGARLSVDPAGRYPVLGAALLTVGLAAGYGALTLVYAAAGDAARAMPWLNLLAAAAAIGTGYRFRLRWPLLLGLLLLFHGIGSWHGYAGHGSYFLGIHDELRMAIVAALVAALGLWHEAVVEERLLEQHVGFGGVYVVMGLLYVNLSLWILSLWPGGLSGVLVFTGAAIAQIVLGARLKDARFTGFGIVFLSIDLYTRLFESFWDRVSGGIFLLAAGALAMGLGGLFERTARRRAEPA